MTIAVEDDPRQLVAALAAVKLEQYAAAITFIHAYPVVTHTH